MTRRRWVGTLVAVTVAALSPAVAPMTAACADEATVAVVVRGADGVERGACVPAAEATDGLAALQATGAKVVTREYGGDLGHAVCSIDGQGNRVDDCPGVGGHWHYWHTLGGAWMESEEGPSQTHPAAGTAEGWTWVEGSTASPPKVEDADAICDLPDLATASAERPLIDADRAEAPWGFAVLGAFGVVAVVGAVAARRRGQV